jgi:hypothetical protein
VKPGDKVHLDEDPETTGRIWFIWDDPENPNEPLAVIILDKGYWMKEYRAYDVRGNHFISTYVSRVGYLTKVD